MTNVLKKIVTLAIVFTLLASTAIAAKQVSFNDTFEANPAGTKPVDYKVTSVGGNLEVTEYSNTKALKIERKVENVKLNNKTAFVAQREFPEAITGNFSLSFDIAGTFYKDSTFSFSLIGLSGEVYSFNKDNTGSKFKNISIKPNESGELEISENDIPVKTIPYGNATLKGIQFSINSKSACVVYVDNISVDVAGEAKTLDKDPRPVLKRMDPDRIHLAVEDIYLDLEVPPTFINTGDSGDDDSVESEQVLMIPLAPVAEHLEATLTQDGNTIKIVFEEVETSFVIGENKAIIKGEEVILEAPAQLLNNTLMLPLSFYEPAFRSAAFWKPDLQYAKISVIRQKPVNLFSNGKEVPAGGEQSYPHNVFIDIDYKAKLPILSGIGTYANMEIFDVTDNPNFTKGLRVETYEEPSKTHFVQIKPNNGQAIKKGDVILLRFYVKSIMSKSDFGNAQLQVCLQQNHEPFGELGKTMSYGGDGEWLRYDYPFVAKLDAEAGKTQLTLSMGYKPQIIEFGGFEFHNYGQNVKIEDLPRTFFSYEGRAIDAPWRAEAAERIEQIRKGDFTITVVDKSGKPVDDAEVKVDMTKHDFQFGTATSHYRTLHSNEDGAKYREKMLENFTRVTPESGLKAIEVEKPDQYERQIREIDWFVENNMQIRGHAVVWERNDMVPAAVLEAVQAKDKEKTIELMTAYLKNLISTFKGKIFEWDIMNEPVTNYIVREFCGWETMVLWYKLAQEIDPDLRLYVNENRLEGQTPSKLDTYIDIMKFLIDRGVQLDGTGIQSHSGGGIPEPERILRNFDVLSQFGNDLIITEFSNGTDDVELQADVMRDYLTVSFSHPKVVNFTMWGFWDGQHFLKNSPMYNLDWTLKPSGAVYKDLVFNQWWTKVSGKTDADGEYNFRAFYGDHDVTVTYKGKTYKATADIYKHFPSGITVVVD